MRYFKNIEGAIYGYSPDQEDLILGLDQSWVEVTAEVNNVLVSSMDHEVRARRDQLLRETDWTQLLDIDEGVRAMYAAYRQALRDIPLQEGFPESVTWPDLP